MNRKNIKFQNNLIINIHGTLMYVKQIVLMFYNFHPPNISYLIIYFMANTLLIIVKYHI